MRRRTLIQSVLALAAAMKVPGAKAWAQTVSFPGTQEDTLRELAAVVLPTSLGRSGTDAVATQFADWVRGYRPGAEMTPGYGAPRLRYKGPSPAPVYQAQLVELAGSTLSATDPQERRSRLAASLAEAGIQDFTGVPEGRHVVADLMGFWFLSPAANDLAYDASIGRNQCRTLANSGSAPAPLAGGRTDGRL